MAQRTIRVKGSAEVSVAFPGTWSFPYPDRLQLVRSPFSNRLWSMWS